MRFSSMIFSTRRILFLLALTALAGAQAAEQISEDRELKEIDLTAWNCVNRPTGTGKSPDTAERNRLKNRWLADLSGLAIKPFDTASLLKHFADFEIETNGKRRKDLSADQKRRLEILEAPLASLTGYLVLAYPGPAESTNCGNVDFHDWHLEILGEPLDHPPQPGDPTPIIAEITPRTQNAIYRDGIRVQELAAFFRRPDVSYESTGHSAQKIRVTGYLLWDDEHNDSTKDVGTTIRSIGRNRYHNPWRVTAWEIHPVIKIERADAAPPSVPASSPEAAPVVPNATPQQYVTILRAVKIKIPYGETVLQRGTRLPIVSRDATMVTVRYLDSTYPIPIASTDLR
ncbi:MAG TPA: hypothetical protein VH252_02500 [Chthoniobacterales bacterium]|nr:hypothetical protein [Chthoniobacterales bacterium]